MPKNNQCPDRYQFYEFRGQKLTVVEVTEQYLRKLLNNRFGSVMILKNALLGITLLPVSLNGTYLSQTPEDTNSRNGYENRTRNFKHRIYVNIQAPKLRKRQIQPNFCAGIISIVGRRIASSKKLLAKRLSKHHVQRSLIAWNLTTLNIGRFIESLRTGGSSWLVALLLTLMKIQLKIRQQEPLELPCPAGKSSQKVLQVQRLAQGLNPREVHHNDKVQIS